LSFKCILRDFLKISSEISSRSPERYLSSCYRLSCKCILRAFVKISREIPFFQVRLSCK
jgi:hypothetical protein